MQPGKLRLRGRARLSIRRGQLCTQHDQEPLERGDPQTVLYLLEYPFSYVAQEPAFCLCGRQDEAYQGTHRQHERRNSEWILLEHLSSPRLRLVTALSQVLAELPHLVARVLDHRRKVVTRMFIACIARHKWAPQGCRQTEREQRLEFWTRAEHLQERSLRLLGTFAGMLHCIARMLLRLPQFCTRPLYLCPQPVKADTE